MMLTGSVPPSAISTVTVRQPKEHSSKITGDRKFLRDHINALCIDHIDGQISTISGKELSISSDDIPLFYLKNCILHRQCNIFWLKRHLIADIKQCIITENGYAPNTLSYKQLIEMFIWFFCTYCRSWHWRASPRGLVWCPHHPNSLLVYGTELQTNGCQLSGQYVTRASSYFYSTHLRVWSVHMYNAVGCSFSKLSNVFQLTFLMIRFST